MQKEVTVDMTTGSIAPQILRFAMPVLLGLIFQRIYNFADSYIVGRFLGDNALCGDGGRGALSERYMEAESGQYGDGIGYGAVWKDRFL